MMLHSLCTQLNFYIDDDTFESPLCRNKDQIEIISRERRIMSLNKIILSPIAKKKGFVELERSGLLPLLIFPNRLGGVETRNGRSLHKDNFTIRWKCWTISKDG